MKVKVLIEQLKKENPEALVVVESSNFELGQEDVEVTMVYASKGKKIKKNCTDAFDGGRYSTPVIRSSEDGDLDLIIIRG